MFKLSKKINDVISVSVNGSLELIMMLDKTVYVNENICPVKKIFSASIYKGHVLVTSEEQQMITNAEFNTVAVFGPLDLLFDAELMSRETQYLNEGGIVCNWHKINYSTWEVENSKLFSTEYNLPIFVSDKLFIFWGYNERHLVCYDDEKNIIWNMTGSDFGTYYSGVIEREDKIVHYAGNFENHLLFSLESGGTIILDVTNGNVLKKWPTTLVTHNLQSISQGSSLFWGANHMTFIEIDAGKVMLNAQIDLTDELKRMANIPAASPNWVGVNTAIVHDSLIYFLADVNYLAIFDPAQKKIIWSHKFEFEKKATALKGGIENFYVTTNKIYVLDNAGTLHIFEKVNLN